MENIVKCVMVGDSSVGKTCLVLTYSSGSCPSPEGYIPAVCDLDYSPHPPPMVVADGTAVHFNLLDTPGTEYQDRLRPLFYPNTNVFILCFSLVDRSTLQTVETKWYPVLSYWCPNTPIVLVGTKLDERDDAERVEAIEKSKGSSAIAMEEGLQMRDKLKNVVSYMECSSLAGQGVVGVFEEAARVGLAHKLEYSESNNNTVDSSCCTVL